MMRIRKRRLPKPMVRATSISVSGGTRLSRIGWTTDRPFRLQKRRRRAEPGPMGLAGGLSARGGQSPPYVPWSDGGRRRRRLAPMAWEAVTVMSILVSGRGGVVTERTPRRWSGSPSGGGSGEGSGPWHSGRLLGVPYALNVQRRSATPLAGRATRSLRPTQTPRVRSRTVVRGSTAGSPEPRPRNPPPAKHAWASQPP